MTQKYIPISVRLAPSLKQNKSRVTPELKFFDRALNHAKAELAGIEGLLSEAADHNKVVNRLGLANAAFRQAEGAHIRYLNRTRGRLLREIEILTAKIEGRQPYLKKGRGPGKRNRR